MQKKKIFWLLFVLMGACASLSAQLNTERIMAIGRNALYFEDYVLSIQYFNQVIKIKPYMAEPYMYRAIAKTQLGDYYGAEKDCNESIKRNPFLPGVYYIRGFIYRSMGKYAEAEADANMPEGSVRYEIREYEGSDEIVSPYVVGTPTGGVKLQFLSADSAPVAYIWLSRSRTEPVCRIMACVKGGNMVIHDHLLAWQRSMEERADRVVF